MVFTNMAAMVIPVGVIIIQRMSLVTVINWGQVL